MNTWDLLIGGYTDQRPESAATASGPPAAVRWASLDDAGRLVDRGRLDCGTNPSWLTMHPQLPVAYACGEDFASDAIGTVTAWYLGGDTPTLLGTGSSGGHAPCHALVVPDGERHALVLSHYVGGQVSVVPLDFDGRPSATASDVVAHAGASLVNPERQEAAHPHQAMFDPVGELVWVSDLGQDRVVAYRVRAGRLTEVGSLATAPGFGPRHAALHPQGDHLALVGELANEVVLYRRGATATTWQQTDSSSTLPAGWPAANTAAALVWSPRGDILYASNRGHDSVAVWRFDASAGRLDLVGHSLVGGNPRDFSLTPDGDWALCAAQDEDRAAVYRVRPDGLLSGEVGSLACAGAARVAVRTS